MNKPQHYSIKTGYAISEGTEILATERKVLEYLHKDSESHFDTVKPITQHSLGEFRKRLQEEKEKLDVKREDDEEK